MCKIRTSDVVDIVRVSDGSEHLEFKQLYIGGVREPAEEVFVVAGEQRRYARHQQVQMPRHRPPNFSVG